MGDEIVTQEKIVVHQPFYDDLHHTIAFTGYQEKTEVIGFIAKGNSFVSDGIANGSLVLCDKKADYTGDGIYVVTMTEEPSDCVKTTLSSQAIGLNYANLQYKLALLHQNRQKIKMFISNAEM